MSDRTKRLSRLGNAVVPQVAEWIGRRLYVGTNLLGSPESRIILVGVTGWLLAFVLLVWWISVSYGGPSYAIDNSGGYTKSLEQSPPLDPEPSKATVPLGSIVLSVLGFIGIQFGWIGVHEEKRFVRSLCILIASAIALSCTLFSVLPWLASF